LPEIISVFTQEIVLDDDLDEDLKREMVNVLKHMVTSLGPTIGSVFASLSQQGVVPHEQLRQLQNMLLA
jgi:hypothetical protein